MTINNNNNHLNNKKLINFNQPINSSPSPSNQINQKIIKQTQFDQNTLNQIDRIELQTQWGPHLVPLQFIIQRTIAQVFHSLQIASQISPNLEEHDRKKRVVDFIIHSRRQLIKLLVLVKWSSNSISVHKIMSIVAFLQRQNHQFERTVNILRASKENFHSARMRNYDIPTALQVLTNGYPTLPAQLIEQFDTKNKLSDSQVIDIMHELNQLIRYRLASDEVIPKEFRSYRILDGRVFFKFEKMFECSLTVGGGQLNSRWFLLHVEFLFKVTGPRGKDFLPIPQGPIKNQIIECGNSIMAPSAPPTETDPDPKPPERPIMKVFAYLRDLCLNYQLETLHYQASQLGRSAWAKHTRLSTLPDRSTLRILYWTHARPVNPPLTRPGQTSQPNPLGSLTIKRHVEKHGQSRLRVLNFLNRYPPPSVPSQTLPQDANDDGDFGASYTERLQTIWRPIEIQSNPQIGARSTLEELENLKIREGNDVFFVKQAETGTIELELVMNQLSLEDILQRVVRIHTDCVLRRAFSDLTRSERLTASGNTSSSAPPTSHFRSVRLVPWDDNSPTTTRHAKSIEIVLHARHAVELSIDEFSGRFRLQYVIVPDRGHARSDDTDECQTIDRELRTNCLGGFNSVNVLSSSASSINFNPSGLRDVLARLKSDLLLDQIELKARILGIRTTRNLPIQIQQISLPAARSSYASSNAIPSPSSSQSIMYCRLPNFPYHFMLIQVTEIGIHCALILVAYHKSDLPSSNNLFWNVRQVSNIQVPSFSGDSDDDGGVLDHFTLSRAQLQHVYHHCLIQVTSNQLMEGLKEDGISYEQLLPLTPKIIRQQEQYNLHSERHIHPSKLTTQLPQLHPSCEVVGLLSVPLLAFLNPTLVAQKHLFSGHNLAVKVFIQPNSPFGVQVEVRFKFDSAKIKSNELEQIMKSKQKNLNSEILSAHISNRLNLTSPTSKPLETTIAATCLENPKEEEEEEDSDDEEPLSKRIQSVKFLPTSSNLFLPTSSNLGFPPPQQQVDPEEEEQEIQNFEDDNLALDSQLVEDTDWTVDSCQNQFIFTSSSFNFSNFSHRSSSNPFSDIYLSSIRKFFNLIHAPSDLNDFETS